MAQPLRSPNKPFLRKVELPDKEMDYHYNTIKGRIAEILVEELFSSMNYRVFRYGMENTVPGIVELLKGMKTVVAQEISNMPDFVIQHRDNKNEVHFIEVKFRADGDFKLENLKKNYPYKNAFIILISRKHIKCLSVEELIAGKCFTADCTNYLGDRKEFHLDKEIIRIYCRLANQFFHKA
jgi:hypothetical protein